ncbi:MAG: hypothetical protein R3A45_07970 [Bdellovibrionota bacterium]
MKNNDYSVTRSLPLAFWCFFGCLMLWGIGQEDAWARKYPNNPEQIFIEVHQDSLPIIPAERIFFTHMQSLLTMSEKPIEKMLLKKVLQTSSEVQFSAGSILSSVDEASKTLSITFGEMSLFDSPFVNPDAYSNEAEFLILKSVFEAKDYIHLVRKKFHIEVDLEPNGFFIPFTKKEMMIIYETFRNFEYEWYSNAGAAKTLIEAMQIKRLIKDSRTSDDAGHKINKPAKSLFDLSYSITGENKVVLHKSDIIFFADIELQANNFKNDDGRDHTQELSFESKLIHEMGHAIWFNLLSVYEKKEYVDISWEKVSSDAPYTAKSAWENKEYNITTNEMLGKYAYDIDSQHHKIIRPVVQPDGTYELVEIKQSAIPREDFPVHFEIFVQNPGKLQKQAPTKYTFIKDKVMRGAEYRYVGYENLSFYLNNGISYNSAPSILHWSGVSSNVNDGKLFKRKEKVLISKEDSKEQNFLGLIEFGLKYMDDEELKEFTVDVKLMIPNYLIKGNIYGKTHIRGDHQEKALLVNYVKKKLELSYDDYKDRFVPGRYIVEFIRGIDYYDNSTYLSQKDLTKLIGEDPIWKIPGTMTKERAQEIIKKEKSVYQDQYKAIALHTEVDEEGYKSTSLEDFQFSNDHPMKKQFQSDVRNQNLFRVDIDKKHVKELEKVELKFKSASSCKMQENLRYYINFDYEEGLSKPGDQKISMYIYVDPEFYGCEVYDLKSVQYWFDPIEEKAYYTPKSIEVKYTEPNALLKRPVDASIYKGHPTQINIPGIKFDLIENPNHRYHYQPDIDVPVEHYQDRYLDFRIRIDCIEGDGAGKYSNQMYRHYRIDPEESDVGNNEDQTNIELKGGEGEGKNLEQGKYIIESIEVETEFKINPSLDFLKDAGVNMPANQIQELDLNRKVIQKSIDPEM